MVNFPVGEAVLSNKIQTRQNIHVFEDSNIRNLFTFDIYVNYFSTFVANSHVYFKREYYIRDELHIRFVRVPCIRENFLQTFEHFHESPLT